MNKKEKKSTSKTKAELLEEISLLQGKLRRLEKQTSGTKSSIDHSEVAETVTDGIYIYTKDGFQSVNDSLAKMLGYTSQEFLKKSIRELVAPEFVQLVEERAKLRLNDKHTPNNYDIELIHKDGKTRIPVNLNLKLTKTDKGPIIIGFVKNNTEKRRISKKLELVNEKFNAITSFAADGIFIITKELRITYWNKAAQKIFGFSYADVIDKNLFSHVLESNNSKLKKIVSEIIDKTEKKLPFENFFQTEVVNKNNKTVSVEISVSTIDNEDEQHLIFIIRDISDRVENEKQLEAERSLTRYFMDYIPFSIYFKDLESRFIKVNKATAQKLGFSNPEDVIGKTDSDIFTSEHTREARNDELKLINGEEKIINKVEKETWKDGRITWVSTTKVPLRDKANNIIGTFGITHDFTEVKKSQLIQQTLLKISSAVNNAEEMDELYYEIHQAVGNLMKADNFYIALYNQETKMLSFPYFVDEFDPIPEPRIAGRGLTEYILRSGKAHLIDTELDLALRKLGETSLLGESSKIWLGVPLKIEDRTIGALVVQDYQKSDTYGEEELQILTYVSEQIASAIIKKNAQEQLKKYSAELQEMNASKDKFFSIIAHDLKSPFQGLLGLSRLIVEEYAELSQEELKSFVNALNESAETTYGLIENLLEWSRLQTGRMKFNPAELNLNDIIEDIKMLLYQTAEMKNIKIKNEMEKDISVWADKHMISSLIQNLISNAIKFTNRFGEISIRSILLDDKYEVRVIDSGVGIESEEIENLFRIESTYSTRGTEQEKGTGLGLILCKEIVNRHGGEIKIESEKGKGTQVIFTLKKSKH